MPAYQYVALDKGGDRVKGSLTAINEQVARREIRKKGLFVVSLGEDNKTRFSLLALFGSAARSRASVSRREMVFFTRQLATLLKSGFTLDGALGAISEQITSPAFHRVLIDIDKNVKEGRSLNESLKNYPSIFPEIYTSMVKAGEASGELPAILGKLADYSVAQARLRAKIIATLIYPIIIAIVASVVVAVLMIYVVPNITSVLTDQKKELPFVTELLIRTSHFFANWGLVLFASIIGLVMAARAWYRTAVGRKVLDKIILKIPLLGNLMLKVAIARFAATFAVLLKSGVDILKSMSIVQEVVGNVILQRAVELSAKAVGQGDSLVGPLADSGLFPPICLKMIESGQKSGNLEAMLETIAEDYEDEVENSILAMTSILEPLMVVIMAIVVGTIVVAILLPLQDMTGMN